MSIRRQFLTILFLSGLTWVAGCARFDLSKNIPWVQGKDGKFEQPMKVVAVWTDTVMTQENRGATRGFGGRLMFYGAQENQPIKVAGTLTIYAFDETQRDPANVVPDRKFVFTNEQFAKHYSKSPLGHSYSVWLPWDQAGGEQREISLIVRFTPTKGGVVASDQSKQLLPGRTVLAKQTPPGSTPQVSGASPVQPVGFQQPLAPVPDSTAPAGDPSQRMNTTTITIPSQFGVRTPEATIGPRTLEQRGTLTNPASATGWNSAEAAAPSPAAEQASQAGRQPAIHSARSRFPARGGPFAPPDRGRESMPPRPAARPFPQQPLPAAYQQQPTASQANVQTGATSPR
jgi:hypothetical protein